MKNSESCLGSRPEEKRARERQKKTKPSLVAATGAWEAKEDLVYHAHGLARGKQRLPNPEFAPWQFIRKVPIRKNTKTLKSHKQFLKNNKQQAVIYYYPSKNTRPQKHEQNHRQKKQFCLFEPSV